MQQSWGDPLESNQGEADSEEDEEADDGPWKSRILCLTVRRAKGAGQALFRPFLSLLRTSEDEESGYEISHMYALKQIKEIRVPLAKEHHHRDGARLRPLDLHVAGQAQQAAGSGASVPLRALRQGGGDESTIIELGLHGEGEGKQMMVLALISELLKQEGKLKVPKMAGIGQEEVDKWWASHREDALGALGESPTHPPHPPYPR
jgi:hypothetical protein